MALSEFKLIEKIKSHLLSTHADLLHGIGDDCAVIEKDAENVFLVSTDSLIEGVHFDLSYFSFIDLGKKALSVNLSDIAAMAGKPLCAVVSLAIPSKISEEQIIDFYSGLEQVALEFKLAIAGGDISKSPSHFCITVTVMGEAKKDAYKLRSKAQVGDGIYVSGVVGAAAVGLAYFQKKKKVENPFIQAFKNPRPRLNLAKVLAEIPEVHAAIDVSDGLLQDLGHVARLSDVGVRVNYGDVPRAPDFEKACQELKLNPAETLLAGGEDYQLLFTMSDKGARALDQKLSLIKNLRVTRIGEIVSKEQGVKVFDEAHQEIKVKKTGFDHFISNKYI